MEFSVLSFITLSSNQSLLKSVWSLFWSVLIVSCFCWLSFWFSCLFMYLFILFYHTFYLCIFIEIIWSLRCSLSLDGVYICFCLLSGIDTSSLLSFWSIFRDWDNSKLSCFSLGSLSALGPPLLLGYSPRSQATLNMKLTSQGLRALLYPAESFFSLLLIIS